MPEYEGPGEKVEAARWFQNGDHPKDEYVAPSINEGKFVRRFRHPKIKGTIYCNKCGYMMHDHGWVDQYGQGVVICPGNWVIEHEDGMVTTMDHERFEKEYTRII